MSESSSARRASARLLFPFIMVTVLFFLWGFCHAMLDVMNKYFQGALDISKARSGLLQTAVYGGYFLMALPAGLIMRRLGYKGGILIGLGLVATGALLFIPASTTFRTFESFLVALFVLACGLTCLETAANPYVTVLGPAETAASRLVLSQSFNAVGWILGPMVGGLLLFGSHSAATQKDAEVSVGATFDALPTTCAGVPLPAGFVVAMEHDQCEAALRELIAYAGKESAPRRALVFRVVDAAEASAADAVARAAGKDGAGISAGYARAIDSDTLALALHRGDSDQLRNDVLRIPRLSQPTTPVGSWSDGTVMAVDLQPWEQNPHGAKLVMVKLYNFSALLFPYVVLGCVVLAVFIVFFLLRLPEVSERDDTLDHRVASVQNERSNRSLLSHPHFIGGVLAQFLYVAGQTAVNAFALNFIIENQGGSETHAAYLVGLGLTGFAIGRFTGSALLRWIAPARLLAIYGLINVIILGLVMMNMKPVSSWVLLSSWFFMSIMFPTIFALSLRDLGSLTKIGSSLLVMAIVGGAIAPPIMGLLADHYGMALCFVVPLVCFAYVGVYGLCYSGLVRRSSGIA